MHLLDKFTNKFTIRFQPFKERFRSWIWTTKGQIIFQCVLLGVYTIGFILTAPLRAPKPEKVELSWLQETLRKYNQPELVEIRYPETPAQPKEELPHELD